MNKCDEFLKRYNMHWTQIDAQNLIENFIDEIQKSRNKQESSISMIPSYLNLTQVDKTVEKVVAVDAGGTNLRVSLVDMDENHEPYIVSKDRYGMPGKDKQITAEEFFKELVDIIGMYSDSTEYMGISFAYKGEITPEKDYIIYKMCKEVDITGIDGKSLSDGINEQYEKKYNKRLKISSVNDTTACLIGTVSNADIANFGACIGMVLGTGFNICYKENMKRVKGSSDSDLYDIVVTEAGFFDKLDRGVFDEKIDNESMIPYDHYFEKMISGKYLPIIYNECMKKALEEGLISDDEFIEEHCDGRYLNYLLEKDAMSEDEMFAKAVSENICKRSALLAALSVAATVIASVENVKTAIIVPEGSTVLKMKDFMKNFEYFLNEYLTDKHGISFVIQTAENSVLKGTAKAVLM